MKKNNIFLIILLGWVLINSNIHPKSVLLDPGHRNSAGKTGAPGVCNVTEAEFTEEFANKAYSELKSTSCGIWDVFQTRKSRQVLSLDNRIAMANNTSGTEKDAFGNNIPLGGVDLFYSIHCNSGVSTASGAEMYYYDDHTNLPKTKPSRNLGAVALGAYLYETTSKNYDRAYWRGKGIKPDTETYHKKIRVLRRTEMPAILLETGFISNTVECENMKNPAYVKAAGKGIRKGITCFDKFSGFNGVRRVITSHVNSNTAVYNCECLLVKNTNRGGKQSYLTGNWAQVNIDWGAFAVTERNTSLKEGATGSIQLSGQHYSAPGGGFFFRDDISKEKNSTIAPLKPKAYELLQNFPNPSNPGTTIKFALPKTSQVEISIYAINGQRVKKLVSSVIKEGHHSTQWDGSDDQGNIVASGVYIYRLKTPEKTITKRLMLLK